MTDIEEPTLSNPLSSLCHALATPAQLSTSSSQLDAVPADLESSVRLAGTQLTQVAGIALDLPQEIIAQAIVVLLRFYIGPQGGSVRRYAVKVRASLVSPSLFSCSHCHMQIEI
jgi:cyclin L